MGILNATPDSFSDGGLLLGNENLSVSEADGRGIIHQGSSSGSSAAESLSRAVDTARRMVRDGADLLDVGGQSTRPGSVRVSASDEASRVIPLIKCVGVICVTFE